MIKIDLKPMSVNHAWQGKQFRTKAYLEYTKKLFLVLPKMAVSKNKLEINFIFGISSNSDIDNPLKCLIDIFQKKYHFDDKDVMKLTVEKEIVKQGQEYFMFEIKEYKQNL